MAQVTWTDETLDVGKGLTETNRVATIHFDHPETVVVLKVLQANPDFLQNAVIELVTHLARGQNQAELFQKIDEIRRGQFGKLGGPGVVGMTLA